MLNVITNITSGLSITLESALHCGIQNVSCFIHARKTPITIQYANMSLRGAELWLLWFRKTIIMFKKCHNYGSSFPPQNKQKGFCNFS